MELSDKEDGGSPGIFCSLVIPCYNEGGNIGPLVKGFAGALKTDDFELILVDNGSIDSSAGILSALAPEFPFLRVVSVPENIGYGHGINQGLKTVRGQYIGWAHGDMQYSPAEIMKAVELLKTARGQKIFLKGLRIARPVLETIFTSGMAVFESLLFGASFWDINAQPTLFHRSLLEDWAGAPEDFSLDLYAYALARKKDFTVRRLALTLSERTRGSSSWNQGFMDRVKMAVLTVKGSLRVKRSIRGDKKNGA